MQTVQIENISKNTLLASHCEIADNYWTRLKGLMGRPSLSWGRGLWIIPCNSIHMMNMRFPIDVVFVDRDLRVVYLIEAIQPWRVSPVIRAAHSVIELPVGVIRSSGTQVGDRLKA